MVPAAVVILDRLPVGRHGKLDRAGLPDPAQEEPRRAFEPRRDPVEEEVAALWRDLLALDRVGRHDNFFELGGHSLLAARVVAALHERFGVEVPLRTLFEKPTVAGVAEAVEEALRVGAGLAMVPLRPVRREGELPLSFAQQRLWFLDQLDPGNPFYNLLGAVRLRGVLVVEALEGALAEIVARHEALRTTFVAARNGQPRQVIGPPPPPPWPWCRSGRGPPRPGGGAATDLSSGARRSGWRPFVRRVRSQPGSGGDIERSIG